MLAADEALNAPDLSASSPEHPPPHSLFTIASGVRAKARDILAAIRAVNTIEHELRPATPGERKTLARFAGFGPVALSIFPDPITGGYKDATWQAVGEELKSLITPDEYDSAKRTTFNAFYTSPIVIAAIHEGLCRLGLPGNATILEPGCGTGNFMSLGQPGMRFIGVELDRISGRIARALHPDQDIRIENFRDTRLPDDSVDGVIGNVPFADVKLEYRGQKLSMHDFFFAKSIDALKPGGVLALVTTHYTLDKQNAAIREYLSSKADLVGAIRLPSDAFKREGTAVVTDIIFMRKRSLDEAPNHADPEWLGVTSLTIENVEIPINRYFLNHPLCVRAHKGCYVLNWIMWRPGRFSALDAARNTGGTPHKPRWTKPLLGRRSPKGRVERQLPRAIGPTGALQSLRLNLPEPAHRSAELIVPICRSSAQCHPETPKRPPKHGARILLNGVFFRLESSTSTERRTRPELLLVRPGDNWSSGKTFSGDHTGPRVTNALSSLESSHVSERVHRHTGT